MNDKHFIIVTGFTDKKFKEDYLINLVKKIRKKINSNDITLCYSSHYTKFNEVIFELFDYVIFNKYNPILNWDIHDGFTRTFGCEVTVNDDQSILFFQPYHGYAHHLSICDGINIGLNTDHKSFTVMNYDCIDFCIDELPIHIKKIRKNRDTCIFYNFAEEEQDYNTEFFTFNENLAIKINDVRDYDKFSKFPYMMYEKIISYLIKQNKIKIEKRKFKTENKALGKVSYADDTTGKFLNDKFYAPFYEKWIDGHRYCYYFFPLLMDNKKYLVFIDESHESMKCYAKINGEKIEHPPGTLLEIHAPSYNLEVYDGDDRVVYQKIHDSRQYAVLADKQK